MMLAIVFQPDASPADHLLDAGKMLKHATRCDCEGCRELVLRGQTRFALIAKRFEEASHGPGAGLVFRALFEGWSIERIEDELNRLPAPATK